MNDFSTAPWSQQVLSAGSIKVKDKGSQDGLGSNPSSASLLAVCLDQLAT